jgi:hypothetical protein
VNLRIALAVSLITAAWVLVCTQQDHMSVNPASRYATMEALVEHGTFTIDDTHLVSRTVDKVKWEGRFYSSKPPLLPTLLTPIYAGVRAVTGEGFREAMYPTARVMRVFVAFAPWAIAMVLWAALVFRLTPREDERALLIIAMVAGGLPTAYGSHLDNHSFAFGALVAAAVAAAPVVQASKTLTASRAALAGLAAGAAVTFDLGAAPLSGLMVVWVAWTQRSRPRVAVSLLAAAAVPLACQVAISYAMTGDPRPFYLLGASYDYPGSYWNNRAEFDALSEPKWRYALHSLIGHHGLFSVTPWLVLALPWFFRREETPAAEALRRVAIAATLFIVAYYVRKTTNYGGRCVGMRWYMVLHPVLAIAAARTISRYGMAARRPVLLGVLIALSAVSALPGAINPWEEGLVHALLRAIGMGSVPG